MPSVHSSVRRAPIQPFPVPQPNFTFPTNKHLLITTPSRILSWDASGIHELFRSSRSGIAAATESKDGSGTLAVADKHVVVLHDIQRGKEKSWGLSAQEDEVRHLEYTKDSQSLFLTTAASNAIQCYSVQAEQLLSPPQTLSSPAAALAISPSGHLMISAQGSPPVVFLKDLSKNSTATLLKPQASTAGISIVAFHPERANIFLLAFDDGSLAVFDATRVRRGAGEGKYNDQTHTGKAEIGRKRELHKALKSKTEGKTRAIAGAAFLPGHALKTVTVGIDGRCKLLDFSNGVNVLRTWHAETPLMCVSVSALPTLQPERDATRKTKSSVRVSDSNTLIAVGSQGGKVLLYDTLGLLQSEKQISSRGERIISVEWIAGDSPKSVYGRIPEVQHETPLLPSLAPNHAKTGEALEIEKSTPKHLSIHPALRPSTMNPIPPASMQSRRFVVHPDEEMNDSTVRHTPSAERSHMVSAEAGEYLDLFSPVNPFIAEKSRASRDQSYSPTRVRPRISSQTFARNTSSPKRDLARTRLSKGLTLSPTVTDSHATSSSSVPAGIKRNVQFRSFRATALNSPLRSERRRLNAASTYKRNASRADSGEAVDATVAANARLLRDLRQMGARTETLHAGGVLSGCASKIAKSADVNTIQSQQLLPSQASKPEPLHVEPQGEVEIYGPGGRWPTDSVDEPSWSEEQQDDIWITSDEERNNKSTRRIHGIERPAARQTSRSRMDSKGTISTPQTTARSPITSPHISHPKTTDRPTSTEDYTTARSHASPNGAFSLASDDVKSIFPRTSSKSPKKSKSEAKQRDRATPRHRKTALQEIASNAAVSRRASNPWDKVKQLKGVPLGQPDIAEREVQVVDDGVAQQQSHRESCGGCKTNASKVKTLESEMAHMKGEILALRAMLRRNGIPAPAVPRR